MAKKYIGKNKISKYISDIYFMAILYLYLFKIIIKKSIFLQ